MKLMNGIALALCLFGCSAVTVRSATSPGADLSHYRTFGWYRSGDVGPQQVALEQSPTGAVIRQQLASDLAAKGLTEATDHPDVLVAYHAKLQNKTQITDWGYGAFRYGGPGGVSVDQYTEGTLLIDFVSPTTGEVVWRGTATAVVDNPDTPDAGKVASAINKVMAQYPSSGMAATSRPAM